MIDENRKAITFLSLEEKGLVWYKISVIIIKNRPSFSEKMGFV